ncbi:MAG: reverse gyrase, partial [Candidatus Njordarchaeota archaeon]
EKKGRVLRLISNFRKKFMRLKMNTKQEIVEAIMQDKKLRTKRMEAIKSLCLDILNMVKDLLSDKEVVSNLKKSPFVEICEEEGRLYIYIPDAKTYIQGSGRTSRLYAGGITKGLAVIVSRRKKLLEALKRRSRWYMEDVQWYDFRQLDLDKVIQEIDRDRKTVMAILEGKIPKRFKELTKSALIIVESPTKAKTIARFFGKPARRVIGNFVVYEITTGEYVLDIVATRGHIYDLTLADIEMRDFDLLKNFFRVSSYLYGVKVTKKRNGRYEYVPEYDVLSICRDCGKRFTGLYRTCPRCGGQNIISQKDILDVIREVADEVDEVLIATDPDAEGEKIGFDIALLLAPYAGKIRRIEYHAVTLAEIRRALKNPRDMDLKRVEAQLVRRILDRWVGFAFSHLLWKTRHITKKFFSYSAGRVQTPVLGWIIDRFEEYKKNRIYLYIITLSNGVTIAMEENDSLKEKWKTLKGKTINVKVKNIREEILNPLPPYNTAEFLKDIAAQLKISASEAMRILQELFESGLITYHRTDSTRVSPEGINVAKEYIQNTFGDLSLFKPRPWGQEAEGAHECIRPTMPINGDMLIRMLQTGELVLAIRFTKRHYAIYQQIFKRFMASQMVKAKVKKASIDLIIDEGIVYSTEGILEILDPGFTAVYYVNMLPDFKDGIRIEKVERMKVSKSPLYTESEIIDKMRKERIGRPSTYAIILDILFKRGYVKASPFRKKIFPLKRGINIYKTLTRKIESYAKKLEKRDKKLAEDLRKFITVEGTRELELEMDKIEKGESNYQEVLEKIHRALSDVLKDLNKYYKKELLPKLGQRIENMIKKDSTS